MVAYGDLHYIGLLSVGAKALKRFALPTAGENGFDLLSLEESSIV